jgi:hypothetical protein
MIEQKHIAKVLYETKKLQENRETYYGVHLNQALDFITYCHHKKVPIKDGWRLVSDWPDRTDDESDLFGAAMRIAQEIYMGVKLDDILGFIEYCNHSKASMMCWGSLVDKWIKENNKNINASDLLEAAKAFRKEVFQREHGNDKQD